MARQGIAEQAAADGTLAGVPRQRRRGGQLTGRDARRLSRSLEALPSFADCRPGDLEALARAGRAVSLPAHWTFLHEQTPADACYVLLQGEVRVLRHDVELTALGPGQVLGEMGLLGHSLRRASVRTATPVLVLRVEYDVLEALLRTRPLLSASLGAVYSQHVDADRRGLATART